MSRVFLALPLVGYFVCVLLSSFKGDVPGSFQYNTTSRTTEPLTQLFRAEIATPGGPLYFGWELREIRTDNSAQPQPVPALKGQWINGSERIEIPTILVTGKWPNDSATIRCDIAHYQSEVQATWDPQLKKWQGAFRKRIAGDGQYTELAFAATPIDAIADLYPAANSPAPVDLSGNWEVAFSSSKSPAVGQFAVLGNQIQATFLTDTGDYRFLSGYWAGEAWVFGCFDGAHAFLFRAQPQSDGQIAGDFWSGSRWHETWKATLNPNATLADPFQQNHWNPDVDLNQLKFADLQGNVRSMANEEFVGEVRLVQLFGSWCPNCHDAANFLGDLYREQNKGLPASDPRRLSIVGLAFELSGDTSADIDAVKKYQERHQIQYPILLAGHADKALASRELGGINEIKAFPTTLFFDRKGNCRAIYSGFSGPATGAAYERLQQAFREKINEIQQSNHR